MNFFIEKNPTLLPQQWSEAEESWNNNAIIKIFETEKDFYEFICSKSICESIWISIDATHPNRNNKGQCSTKYYRENMYRLVKNEEIFFQIYISSIFLKIFNIFKILFR